MICKSYLYHLFAMTWKWWSSPWAHEQCGYKARELRLTYIMSVSPLTATSNPFSQKPQLFSTLLYSLVPIIGLAAVVLFSFWMWRHHKLAYPAALVPTHVSPTRVQPITALIPVCLSVFTFARRCCLISEVTCQSHSVARLRCPLSSKLLADAVSFSFCLFSLGDHQVWLPSVNCKQRGNVKPVSSCMSEDSSSDTWKFG